MNAMLNVRPSPIAGTWYNANPTVLAAELDGYLAKAQLPELDGEVVGVIAPHAGYRYSGPVAGYAFRAVQGNSYDLVVVVSPMHQPYPYPIITSAHSAFETPLGLIEIDQEAVESIHNSLQKRGQAGLTAVARDSEHSLEIELPFLQRSLASSFRLVPLMVRTQSEPACRSLGEAIAAVITDKKALLVASTDLSHYYPLEVANQLDQRTLNCFSAFSPASLHQAGQADQANACGLGAVATVMWAAKSAGAQRVQILHHATSAETSGDQSSVVGYAAAALLR